jgi:hypothetical protein
MSKRKAPDELEDVRLAKLELENKIRNLTNTIKAQGGSLSNRQSIELNELTQRLAVYDRTEAKEIVQQIHQTQQQLDQHPSQQIVRTVSEQEGPPLKRRRLTDREPRDGKETKEYGVTVAPIRELTPQDLAIMGGNANQYRERRRQLQELLNIQFPTPEQATTRQLMYDQYIAQEELLRVRSIHRAVERQDSKRIPWVSERIEQKVPEPDPGLSLADRISSLPRSDQLRLLAETSDLPGTLERKVQTLERKHNNRAETLESELPLELHSEILKQTVEHQGVPMHIRECGPACWIYDTILREGQVSPDLLIEVVNKLGPSEATELFRYYWYNQRDLDATRRDIEEDIIEVLENKELTPDLMVDEIRNRAAMRRLGSRTNPFVLSRRSDFWTDFADFTEHDPQSRQMNQERIDEAHNQLVRLGVNENRLGAVELALERNFGRHSTDPTGEIRQIPSTQGRNIFSALRARETKTPHAVTHDAGSGALLEVMAGIWYHELDEKAAAILAQIEDRADAKEVARQLIELVRRERATMQRVQADRKVRENLQTAEIKRDIRAVRTHNDLATNWRVPPQRLNDIETALGPRALEVFLTVYKLPLRWYGFLADILQLPYNSGDPNAAQAVAEVFEKAVNFAHVRSILADRDQYRSVSEDEYRLLDEAFGYDRFEHFWNYFASTSIDQNVPPPHWQVFADFRDERDSDEDQQQDDDDEQDDDDDDGFLHQQQALLDDAAAAQVVQPALPAPNAQAAPAYDADAADMEDDPQNAEHAQYRRRDWGGNDNDRKGWD